MAELLATSASHLGMPIAVPDAQPVTLLPAVVPGDTAGDGPSEWAPATPMGDKDGAGGSFNLSSPWTLHSFRE